MERPYKLLSIGLVLAGVSAVLALQPDRKPERSNDQAEQHSATDVASIEASPEAAIAKGSQVAAQAPVGAGTGDSAQPELPNVVLRAKANPLPPTSPEHLAAHRAENRMLVRREYSPLFEMLNLSQQQEEDFLEVIVAERLVEMSPAEYRATREKRERERNEKIAAIIGLDKVQVYEDFLQNLNEHTRVTQIGMQLDAAGAALSKQQKEYLVQLLIAERERVPQPSQVKPIMTKADIEHELDWQADQDRRVREGAASVLSPLQLKYLNEVQTARLTKQRVAFSAIPVVE
jgi:hypothetical protein